MDQLTPPPPHPPRRRRHSRRPLKLQHPSKQVSTSPQSRRESSCLPRQERHQGGLQSISGQGRGGQMQAYGVVVEWGADASGGEIEKMLERLEGSALGEFSRVCLRVVLMQRLAQRDLAFLPRLREALERYQRYRVLWVQQ